MSLCRLGSAGPLQHTAGPGQQQASHRVRQEWHPAIHPYFRSTPRHAAAPDPHLPAKRSTFSVVEATVSQVRVRCRACMTSLALFVLGLRVLANPLPFHHQRSGLVLVVVLPALMHA